MAKEYPRSPGKPPCLKYRRTQRCAVIDHGGHCSFDHILPADEMYGIKSIPASSTVHFAQVLTSEAVRERDSNRALSPHYETNSLDILLAEHTSSSHARHNTPWNSGVALHVKAFLCPSLPVLPYIYLRQLNLKLNSNIIRSRASSSLDAYPYPNLHLSLIVMKERAMEVCQKVLKQTYAPNPYPNPLA